LQRYISEQIVYYICNMEYLEIKDRILKILNTENMSSAKFADIIGVQRSNISHILSGRNNPGLDFLQKVLTKFPSINSDWLLIGKGEMFKQTKQTEISFVNQEDKTAFSDQQKTIEKIPQPKEIQIQTIVQKAKSIRQVMVFYDDNTYEILNPEKAETQKENK
jgi:transcriptional regulator with XRE-family HTH domain